MGARMKATFAFVGVLLVPLAAGMAASQPTVPTPASITFLDDPIDGDCLLGGTVTLAPASPVVLVMNYQDDGRCYLLEVAGDSARFYRVADGRVAPAGNPGALKIAGEPRPFAVTRRSCRLAFIYDGVVVCRGWDEALSNGKAGYVAPAGVVGDPYLQPVGPIESTDDFVRQEDTRHMWSELSGQWDIQKLRDDEQADEMVADKSMNAFAYHVVSNGPALSLAETDIGFWDNYHVAVSGRSLGKGAMGVAVLAQDEKNYLLFRWASAWARDAGGNRAQLLEVANGQPRVLVEKPGGFIPDRWYKLDIGVCDGDIVCSVDDLPLLRGQSDRFGLGHPGLYSEGTEGTFFDDVRVEDFETFREDFADQTRWQTAAGEWSTAGHAARCASSGQLTSGRFAWGSYVCSCTVTAGRGAIGVEVARQPDGRGVVFRVGLPGSDFAGKAQLVRVGPEGEQLLSEVTTRLVAGRPHRLGASVSDGVLRGYIDDAPVLDAVDPPTVGGAIGLYAKGTDGAQFSALAVSFPKPPQPAHVGKEFTDPGEHPEMAEWASTRHAWVQPATLEPGAVWWSKGDYFGDTSVTFALRFIGLRDGTLRVTLGGKPDDPKAGLHLLLTASKGSRTLKAQVTSGEAAVGEGQVDLTESSCRVQFSHEGDAVIVRVDDQPLIAKEVREP
jgi:hypothetical protein